jgi:NAD(P)-dependent dehydrogenase (short-subunit alcohol dehydrogenase family)
MTSMKALALDKLFRIDGDVAFVTGAGAGFGRISALTLAAAGATVAVTDIDMQSAAAAAAEIIQGGGRALALRLDVADRKEIQAVVGEVVEAFGGIQILINNAGIARRGPAETLTDEDWDAVVSVNLTGAFACAREVGRHMLEARKGRIVNIASIMGFVGNGMFPHVPYQATKGGLVNLTRSLAVEWADRGVRVNAIAPTFFKTNFGSRLWQDPEKVQHVIDRTPLGRFGEPEEIAGGILYLASEASSMVTGHTLAIDGGWLAL